MRKLGLGLLALAGTVVFLTEARSQSIFGGQGQPASSFMTGVNPRQINFTKIDTSRAMQLPSGSGTFSAPKQPQGIGVGSMFPKISLGSWPPKVPNVSIFPGNPFNKVITNPAKK